jgi:GDP-mannose 4,6 dehydratase
MATRRALITGITGQDGSYLAELLLDKDYDVFGKRTIDLPPLCSSTAARAVTRAVAHVQPARFPAPRVVSGTRTALRRASSVPRSKKAAERYRRQHQVASEEATPFDGLTFHVGLRRSTAARMFCGRSAQTVGASPRARRRGDRMNSSPGSELTALLWVVAVLLAVLEVTWWLAECMY